MNHITDSLAVDRYRHPPCPEGWEAPPEFSPRHGKPPSEDALSAMIRRRAPEPVRLWEICRGLDKPPRVVLPVLRAMETVCVDERGWRVIA